MVGKRPHLRALTSLRWFAALAVVLHHLDYLNRNSAFETLYIRWFAEGFAGVSLFFILSGFVLAYNYSSQFSTLDRKVIASFLAARFSRIWPLHVLAFLLTLLLPWRPAGSSLGERAMISAVNISLLHAWVPVDTYFFSVNSVSWSLSVEWFFYLSFPLLMCAMHRTGMVDRPRVVPMVVGAWLLLFTNALLFGNGPMGRWAIYICPLPRLLEFMSGMVLGLAFVRRSHGGPQNERHLRATLLESAAVVGLIAAIVVAPMVPTAIRLGAYYMPIMTVIVLLVAREQGAISASIRSPLFVYLGEISFGLYLFHQPVLRHLVTWRRRLGMKQELFDLPFGILVVGVTLLLSAACFKVYEKPMRTWLQRLLLRRPQGNDGGHGLTEQVGVHQMPLPSVKLSPQ